ncbi:heat shock 70 kDa protein-like isoform X2 [Zophobas morio]|uniref:heat shock 70 kDa protein-like isoform X2 n=1 Tax=Zophobas morio TaxID=2755281 RepID=UPI00308289FA
MDDLAIGIDLGTTNSCVCVYLNGKLKILENSDGGRITPSFIFFTSLQETIVGEHAKRMSSGKPDHGIYEVKRLVGRKFSDTYLQRNLQFLPFKVKSDYQGDPLIIIQQRNRTLEKTPQQLCAIILQKLKADAEAKLGQAITKVVVTVPAYFNVTQREVTLAAAKEAGFTVLKLLNEPTAAALCYYFDNDCSQTNHSLVYDLGGGTFDVAILKRSTNNIEIVGVDGDTQLGGHDFDNLIVNYVCEELVRDYNYDPRTDKDSLRRLHNKCEDAKKALSAVQQTVITLIGFVSNNSCVQIPLTREQFEKIADELFRKSISIVDCCMKNCGISKTSIKEVILSGGSTRIPKIQKMISDYFDGKALNKFVSPDECVAEGAALQAALLSKSSKQNISKVDLADVTPLSLGTPDYVDEMRFVIKRNQRLPTNCCATDWTTLNNLQTGMTFCIYEGERLNAKKNRFVGELTLTNITPAPPGECKVKFYMNIDENGILSVKAEELYKNNVKELTINYTRGNCSDSEVKNSLLDAENNKDEDKRFEQFVKFKKYLIEYCVAVMYNLDNKKITDTHRAVYELCQETKDSATNMDMDYEEHVKELTTSVKLQCEPHVKYYNFDLMPTLTV